jgi:hypothetical protein
MYRTLLVLIIGVIAGAFSWAIIPFVSHELTPFDSEKGFYIGQVVLSVIAIILGYKYGLKHVLIYVLGIYINSNLYPIIFISSVITVYNIYGLYTTLSFCLYPLVSGIAGKIVKLGYIKYNKSLNQTGANNPPPS